MGGGQRCNAPCLADSSGQPKGSGRHVASLHDGIHCPGHQNSKTQPAAPLQILGLALWTLASSPMSLIFPLWLGHGRQVPLGHPWPFPFSQSWSPQTEVKFRGLSARGAGTHCDGFKVVGGWGFDSVSIGLQTKKSTSRRKCWKLSCHQKESQL